MSFKIVTKTEERRNCGFKTNGYYLTFDGPVSACGRLPLPLDPCPHCGLNLEQTRDFQWVPNQFAKHLVASCECNLKNELLTNYSAGGKLMLPIAKCDTCPMNKVPDKLGLIWIGEVFYSNPQDFLKESSRMGISRKVSRPPRGFRIGETWVWLAHPKCIEVRQHDGVGEPNRWQIELERIREEEHSDPTVVRRTEVLWVPAVFGMFLPQAMQYVVKGTEPEQELEEIAAKGIELITIRKVGETLPLFGEEDVSTEVLGNEIERLASEIDIPDHDKMEIYRLQLSGLRAQMEKLAKDGQPKQKAKVPALRSRIEKLEKALHPA